MHDTDHEAPITPIVAEPPASPSRVSDEDAAKLLDLQKRTKVAVLRAVIAERDLIAMEGDEFLADVAKRYGCAVSELRADGSIVRPAPDLEG